MTNLLNVLKNMETEGVKRDVINYLLENNNNSEDLQGHLENINDYGCASGQVNHLIYYTDTVAYFEEHENEIIEMLAQLGIEDVESWDGLQELSSLFPLLDDADTRHIEAYEDAKIDAKIEMNRCYTASELENMTDDEKEATLDEFIEDELMYINALELTDQDKNFLAWAIFEYEAVNLENELSEMGLIK